MLTTLLSCESEPPNISGPSPDNPIISHNNENEFIVLQLDANIDSTAFGFMAISASEFEELKKETLNESFDAMLEYIIDDKEACEECIYIDKNTQQAIPIDTLKKYKIAPFHKITSVNKHTSGGGVEHHSSYFRYN